MIGHSVSMVAHIMFAAWGAHNVCSMGRGRAHGVSFPMVPQWRHAGVAGHGVSASPCGHHAGIALASCGHSVSTCATRVGGVRAEAGIGAGWRVPVLHSNETEACNPDQTLIHTMEVTLMYQYRWMRDVLHPQFLFFLCIRFLRPFLIVVIYKSIYFHIYLKNSIELRRVLPPTPKEKKKWWQQNTSQIQKVWRIIPR